MPTHPIYSRDATVWIETGTDKLQALHNAMRVSQFFENVEAVWQASGKSRQAFLIAIKPNLMTASIRQDPSPVYTAPELVEALIRGLRERGFGSLAVVKARNVYDYSYQGRPQPSPGRLAG